MQDVVSQPQVGDAGSMVLHLQGTETEPSRAFEPTYILLCCYLKPYTVEGV